MQITAQPTVKYVSREGIGEGNLRLNFPHQLCCHEEVSQDRDLGLSQASLDSKCKVRRHLAWWVSLI